MAILVAGTAFYWGGVRQDPRLRRIGIGVGIAALFWIFLALAIDTPAERLYRAHKDLADAAKNGDVDRIVSYLEPDFQATVLGVNKAGIAKEEIGARLKTYGVKGSTIRFYHSTHSGPAAFTQLNLLTQTEMGPVLTTWQLSWDDVPGQDWRIRDAELVKLGDEAVGQGTVLPK